MPHAASAASASASRTLAWETFEEHAKVAFVENALGSRFFFKSSVVLPPASHATKKPTLRVVTRVTTHRKTTAELTHHTSKFQSSSGDSLARITRLLRFAMQEVLGPMKPHGAGGVTSPRVASLLGPGGLSSSFPLSPTNGAAASSTGDGSKAKKNKKKTKKSGAKK